VSEIRSTEIPCCFGLRSDVVAWVCVTLFILLELSAKNLSAKKTAPSSPLTSRAKRSKRDYDKLEPQ
jgi:hypothetical protein